MATDDELEGEMNRLFNPATVKVAVLLLAALLLLIPKSMVVGLAHERESRKDEVVADIHEKWGRAQTLTGPFLTVPYLFRSVDKEGEPRTHERDLHVLPERLDITGTLTPEVRYRSIYETVVYSSQIAMRGNFAAFTLPPEIDEQDVAWERAVLSLGISDSRGIRDDVTVHLGAAECAVGAGLVNTDVAASGIHCALALSPGQAALEFKLNAVLNGSESIRFVPVGKTTTAMLRADWPDPKFDGAFLPVERNISGEGFEARWKVLHLNRNYPQMWTGAAHDPQSSAFGVDLLVPTDVYKKSWRLSNYAILFIVFTFVAFFFSELLSKDKRRIHPIQYILVGLAVILFYLLLLALAEHLYFDLAYGLAAVATTAALSGYAKAITASKHFTLLLSGILVVLYGYLYIVLQLEDYALLMGSVGLFIVLILIMYLTRKVDWYNPTAFE